jgi:hypothetical protein
MGIMLQNLYAGRERTLADAMFGPEVRIIQLATLASMILPSLVYVTARAVFPLSR